MADGAAEKDIARMTTVYEAMKPAEAAQIFERMDVAFAAGLLARMRPEAAANVLTGMDARGGLCGDADASRAATTASRPSSRRSGFLNRRGRARTGTTAICGARRAGAPRDGAMIGIVGIVIVFVMVFGGYVIAGGKIGIILHSLPYEMMMIAGAATGAFVISNNKHGIVHTLKDVAKVFKGPHWKTQDFQDLLCLMFQLIRIARSNPVELDQHIEDPAASSIFTAYPRSSRTTRRWR